MAQTTIQVAHLTALTSGLATTDEILVSDAGVTKRMDISVLEIAASQITASGTLPALNGAALTALTAANITASGTLPALNGAALTALVAGNITAGGTFLAQNGSALTALNGTQVTSGTLPAARIADDSIVEAKLDVSNGPTDDYFLQAQSGEGGGLTWAAAGSSTLVSGEYTGDGATSLNITGLGMTPKYVKIFLQGLSNNENVQSWETTPEILNDITDGTAIRHNTSTYQTEINTIIGLGSGYFTVDDNSADEHPNVLGGKYNYIAIG